MEAANKFYTKDADAQIKKMMESEGWFVLAHRLRDEIFAVRDTSFESSPTWDEVLMSRGYCKGLARIINYGMELEISGLEGDADDGLQEDL